MSVETLLKKKMETNIEVIDPILARQSETERIEREPMKKTIQTAKEIMVNSISDVFTKARLEAQAKQTKLASLKERLEEIPEEFTKLEKEESKAREDFSKAVESGESLSKLSAKIVGIKSKANELELLRKTLEEKLIPKIEEDLQQGKQNLEDVLCSRLGAALENKMREMTEKVEAVNRELKAWNYARNDIVESTDCNIYGRLSQAQYHFEVKFGVE